MFSKVNAKAFTVYVCLFASWRTNIWWHCQDGEQPEGRVYVFSSLHSPNLTPYHWYIRCSGIFINHHRHTQCLLTRPDMLYMVLRYGFVLTITIPVRL